MQIKKRMFGMNDSHLTEQTVWFERFGVFACCSQSLAMNFDKLALL